MDKSKWFSRVVLVLSILLVFGFNQMSALVSRTIKEDYKQSEKIIYNQNDDFENGALVSSTKDHYIVLEPDSLKCYGSSGRLLWTKTVASHNTLMATGDKTVVIADKKAGDVYVLDQEGMIVSSQLRMGSLRDLKFFNSGYIGLFKEDGTLLIYDLQMKFISSVSLPKGEMIDFDINDKYQDIIAMILDLSRTDFNSKMVIATYNGSIISGSNMLRDVVYDVTCTEDSIIVTTDEGVNVYDYDSQLIEKVPFNRTLNALAYDRDHDQMVYQLNNTDSEIENPQAENSIIVIDAKGKTVKSFDLDQSDIIEVKAFANRYYCLSASELVIYNSQGEKIETYKGTEDINSLLITNADSFALVYGNFIDLYEKK